MMHSNNVMCVCEQAERVLMSSGRRGKLCAACQRDEDDNARMSRPKTATRFCKACQQNKPVGDFLKSSRICTVCNQVRQAAPQTLTPAATRFCQGCKERKPLTAFRREGTANHALCTPCYDARQADAHRREAQGLPALKPVQFRGPDLDLDHVAPEAQPIHHPRAAGVLLVDRERGQVILCAVESEIPMDARRMDEVIAFYAARGHRIVDAVEQQIVEGV